MQTSQSTIDLPGIKKLRSGKVREVFDLGDTLLFVVTDRISAFDVILPDPIPRNVPHMVEADGRLRFDFGEQRMICDGGLQPFMLCTKDGTLIVQVQAPHPPFDTSRMHYPFAMWTVISRDGGSTRVRTA